MSRIHHSLRTRLIGHSQLIHAIFLCSIGIALVLFATFLPLYSVHEVHESENLIAPKTSLRTITGQIYLISISTPTAGIGDTVGVYGNATKWNGAAWDAYVGEIFLVVDGDTTTYQDETTTSDGLGFFNLTFTIDASFIGPNTIQANTSTGGYDTMCWNSMSVTVVAGVTIDINTPDPCLPGTNSYPISGEVRNDITNQLIDYDIDLELWYGGRSGTQGANVTVIDGAFSAFRTHNTNYDFFTLYLPGGGSTLGGESPDTSFNIISDITVSFNSLAGIIYQNSTISISGTVTSGTYALEGSHVTIKLVGEGLTNEIVFDGTLAPGGVFINSDYLVPLEAQGRYEFQLTVNDYMANGISAIVPAGYLTDASTTVRIRPSTFLSNFPWEFIVIGVGAVGVVVGIFFLQRWIMKQRVTKDKQLLAKEIEERLANIRILYTTGRVKEALAYLYVTYTEIAQFRHGIEKQSSQTTTEFAIIMVKQFGQNPQNIYPFIQEIEQVIYGGYPYNDQVFMQAVSLFGLIYLELMEKPLPSFNLT